MTFDFTGKRAVICGGSRGIGRSIALGLAAAGADVSICARGADTLEATRAEIAALGHKAHAGAADLADAARIDGCNEFGIYSRIMLPLAKPALATIAVFVFIGVWNDFTGPLLYLSKSPEKFTVALGLSTFQSQFRTRWDLLMAASTAMLLPIVVIFSFAQRFFIQGIVTTGIKG